MKRFFEYIGILALLCFSFFLTNQTATVVKEVDDIMVQIKSDQNQYQKEGENALVFDSFVVPGLPSMKVDVDASYREMQKIGTYNPDYLQYVKTKPVSNLDNYLDKWIPYGNAKKKMVSIILLTDHKNLSSVLEKLGDYKVSLVLQNYQFQSQSEVIEQAIQNGHQILLTDHQEKDFLAMRQKLLTYQQEPLLCFSATQDEQLHTLCQDYHYYSITTEQVIRHKPLQTTKKILKPGTFLTYEVTNQFLEEFPNIVSYIESRGLTIAPLTNHIKED